MKKKLEFDQECRSKDPQCFVIAPIEGPIRMPVVAVPTAKSVPQTRESETFPLKVGSRVSNIEISARTSQRSKSLNIPRSKGNSLSKIASPLSTN